jgi:hypothetical protein
VTHDGGAGASGPDEDATPQEDRPAAGVEGVDLAAAIGGRRGLLDSGLPGLVFVTVFTLNGQELKPALWAALGLAGLLTVLRVLRREPLTQTLAGLVGVGIAAFFASRTGEARNYFVPGFLLNVGYVLAYGLSATVRWPLVGVLVGPLLGEGLQWRKDPPRLRAYTVATWMFAGLFALRLAVQVPLWLLDRVFILGTVKVLMGVPLFALVAWLSYLVIRAAPPPVQHLAPGQPEPEAPEEGRDPPEEERREGPSG